jgi:hypothetical protein
MELSNQELSTLRKVLAHFQLCKDVQTKYAAAFREEARAIAYRLDSEAERREHMARRSPGSPA